MEAGIETALFIIIIKKKNYYHILFLEMKQIAS